ncbi:MAG: DNA-directed RNA polymerase subunit beta', partial [Sedimentitalea sp.]
LNEQSNLEAVAEGTVEYRDMPVIEDKDGRFLSLARSGEIAVIDNEGRERSADKLPYGTNVLVKDGAKVKLGDKLAEWDPFTMPMITEKPGTIKYQDVIEGKTMSEITDEATGIAQRVITEYRASGRGANKEDLRPRMTLLDKDSGEAGRYMLANGATLSVTDGQDVVAGDIIARVSREAAKTRDITGGLPRVAELFEARRPKDHAIIAEIDGYVRFGRDYKNKRRISIEPADETLETSEYMVPKGKHIPVQEGDFIQKGDYLMDGNPAPHDILSIMGVEALADYMIDEVQDVYRLQGVKINDKHIEVIVRQMLQKWEIQDSGDTTLLKGEHVDKQEFDQANEKALSKNGRPAQGEPILLGITKASLQTRSFISAASFQETTRVLTEASVQGKKDKLVGLKENVIVGRLIPAGTGGATQKVRRVATERDNVVIEARREEAEAAAALAAPTEEDIINADAFDSLVETPESRD